MCDVQKNYVPRYFTMNLFLGAGAKGGPKTPVKPSAQKGAAKTAPPKQAAAAAGTKTPQGKKKKGQRHQQYELIVTINLVREILLIPMCLVRFVTFKLFIVPLCYFQIST